MRIIILAIIFPTLSLPSFSQGDSIKYRIYEFINSTKLLSNEADTYLQEDGSPIRLLKSDDSLDFDYKQCLFVSEQYYYDTAFWDTILGEADKEYMISQIHELKNFKWDE